MTEERPPEDLTPGRLRTWFHTVSMGRSIEAHGTVSSTMDLAREAATRGAPDGHLVLADGQWNGRGRRGHHWYSPVGGNLYLTLLLRRLPGPEHVPLLGLGAALALCEALESLGFSDTQVKWPNDVLIEGRKVAGILPEAPGGSPPVLLLGLGVNVASRPPHTATDTPAVSLAEARPSSPPPRAAVLATWLLRFEAWRERTLRRTGRAALIEALQHRLAWRGMRVCSEDASGLLLGLEEDGALRLLTTRGEHRLRAGTLRLDAENASSPGGSPQAPGSDAGSSSDAGDSGETAAS